MTSKPTKDPKRSVELHIYMTPAEKADVEKQATEDCRSVNGQVLHYIKRGLKQDRGDR